jgi:hypothetical protein
MHIVDLGFRDVYGRDLAARIPRGWPAWRPAAAAP